MGDIGFDCEKFNKMDIPVIIMNNDFGVRYKNNSTKILLPSFRVGMNMKRHFSESVLTVIEKGRKKRVPVALPAEGIRVFEGAAPYSSLFITFKPNHIILCLIPFCSANMFKMICGGEHTLFEPEAEAIARILLNIILDEHDYTEYNARRQARFYRIQEHIAQAFKMVYCTKNIYSEYLCIKDITNFMAEKLAKSCGALGCRAIYRNDEPESYYAMVNGADFIMTLLSICRIAYLHSIDASFTLRQSYDGKYIKTQVVFDIDETCGNYESSVSYLLCKMFAHFYNWNISTKSDGKLTIIELRIKSYDGQRFSAPSANKLGLLYEVIENIMDSGDV